MLEHVGEALAIRPLIAGADVIEHPHVNHRRLVQRRVNHVQAVGQGLLSERDRVGGGASAAAANFAVNIMAQREISGKSRREETIRFSVASNRGGAISLPLGQRGDEFGPEVIHVLAVYCCHKSGV